MIKIREILKDDREIYVNFAEKFYNTDSVLHKVDKNNFYKTFDYILSDTTYSLAYMVCFNDEAVGYFVLSKTYSQEVAGMVMFIEEVYIEREYRNKGIAKQIFEYIFTNFSNYKRYRLEVTKSNIYAIKLYENLGFRELEYIQMHIDKED